MNNDPNDIYRGGVTEASFTGGPFDGQENYAVRKGQDEIVLFTPKPWTWDQDPQQGVRVIKHTYRRRIDSSDYDYFGSEEVEE